MNLTDQVKELLARAGMDGIPLIEPVVGGKNNRVFRVVVNEKQFFLKSYFHHPEDQRERLKTEFSFSNFLWENGVKNIPKPIVCDLKFQLGLYDYIEAKKIVEKELTASLVQQALDFFITINRYKEKSQAQDLPVASEGCFNFRDHLNLVQDRMARLQNLKEEDSVDKEAKDFIVRQLTPVWEKIRRNILGATSLTDEKRCLSPSDFGFHNALLTPTGKIYFHDFEYAGWEDPSQVICNFFCQPTLPVPKTYFLEFTTQVFTSLECRDMQGLQRTKLLLPVYQVKWCCILLNDFFREGNDRRKFAQREDGFEERKKNQLMKAKTYFERQLQDWMEIDKGL